MDKVLEIAATQVPSLVVLVVLVYWFLKHLREDRDSRQATAKEVREDHKAAIKELATDCHAFQQSLQFRAEQLATKANQSLDANTVAMKENTATLGRLEKTIISTRSHS